MSAQNFIADNRVFQEMLTTEETYKRHLGALLGAYESMSQQNQIPNAHIISKNIQVIRDLQQISDDLLANVQTIASMPEPSLEFRKRSAKSRLNLFQQYVAKYAEYLKLYDEMQPLLANSNLDHFNEAIRAELKDNEQGLGLVDLLVEPVQRGPRYKILMEALIKHNEEADDFQKEHLLTLQTHLQQFLSQINKMMHLQNSEMDNSLAEEPKQNLLAQEPKQKLILELINYKEQRSQGDEYESFLINAGISKTDKLKAADKAIAILNGFEDTRLDNNDIKALTQGSLGRLITDWNAKNGVGNHFFVKLDTNQAALSELHLLLNEHKTALEQRAGEYAGYDFFGLGYSKTQKMKAIEDLFNNNNPDEQVLTNGQTGKIIRAWQEKYHFYGDIDFSGIADEQSFEKLIETF